MPNYQQGKIYRIVCNTTGLVYIGSTTMSLNQRFSCHKIDFKRKNKTFSSSLVLENNNCEIHLIEEYPCETSEQLRKREAYYCSIYDCVNKRKAFCELEERINYKRQWASNFRANNPDKVMENTKKYCDIKKQRITCECGANISLSSQYKHVKSSSHIKNISNKSIDTYDVCA